MIVQIGALHKLQSGAAAVPPDGLGLGVKCRKRLLRWRLHCAAHAPAADATAGGPGPA